MRLLAGSIAVLALLWMMGSTAAGAQDNGEPSNDSDGQSEQQDEDSSGGFSADETSSDQGDTTVERTAAVFVETRPPANPIVAATIADESGSAVIGEVDDSSAPSDDDCRERAPSEYNEEGDFYYTGRCIQSRI